MAVRGAVAGRTSEPQVDLWPGQEMWSEVTTCSESLSISLLKPQFSLLVSEALGPGARLPVREQPGGLAEVWSVLSPALAQGTARGGADGGGLVAELYLTLVTEWTVARHRGCFANGGSFILFISDCAVCVQGLQFPD